MIVFNKVDDFVTVLKSSLIQAGHKNKLGNLHQRIFFLRKPES